MDTMLSNLENLLGPRAGANNLGDINTDDEDDRSIRTFTVVSMPLTAMSGNRG